MDCSKIKHRILCEYEDSGIPIEVSNIFKEFGLDMQGWSIEGIEEHLSMGEFKYILMWFVSLSLDAFEWEEDKDSTPCINDCWDDSLNVSIGYGLY